MAQPWNPRFGNTFIYRSHRCLAARIWGRTVGYSSKQRAWVQNWTSGWPFGVKSSRAKDALNLGIDSEMPRPPQSGGWFVLERVSEPNHAAGNTTQAFRPSTDAFSDLGKGDFLGCFSPEFVVDGG